MLAFNACPRTFEPYLCLHGIYLESWCNQYGNGVVHPSLPGPSSGYFMLVAITGTFNESQSSFTGDIITEEFIMVLSSCL